MKEFFLNLCLRLRVLRGAVLALLRARNDITPVGRLSLRHFRADGTIKDLGLVSTKVVTTVGVGFIVDALQGLVSSNLLRYHASGTGVTAENAADTTLAAEVGTRVSGSLGEGVNAWTYRTVATITYAAPAAVTEHGVFSAASAGVLLDRSVFAAVNVGTGESIQFIYELVIPAGL